MNQNGTTLIDHCLKEENKKVIGLMKDQLSKKIMTKFFELRPKAYSFLIGDSSEDKKKKAQKSVS